MLKVYGVDTGKPVGWDPLYDKPSIIRLHLVLQGKYKFHLLLLIFFIGDWYYPDLDTPQVCSNVWL